MKWQIDLGRVKVDFDVDDEVVKGLETKPSDGEIRKIAMFEVFLALGNAYNCAILDEASVRFIAENYDTEKEAILGRLKQLVEAFDKKNDDTTINDSENQSEPAPTVE